MSALVVSKPAAPAKPVPARWAGIDAAASVMAATMLAYLGRLSDELSAASVAAAEVTLRQFAGHVIATDPTCRSVAATGAEHVAAYRAELGQRWASSGERRVLSTTVDYRVATLHRFFGQIAAWGFADTPVVTPFGAGLASPGRPRRRGCGRPAKALANKPGPRPERPAQATWAENLPPGTAPRLHHDWLFRPVGNFAPPDERKGGIAGHAPVRLAPHRLWPRLHGRRRHRPPPCRGLQGGPGRSKRPPGQAFVGPDRPQPPRPAAQFLRAANRLGRP